MNTVSYQPTGGLTYDPLDEKYWDAGALDEETRRVFEICHGCRMCFKFCDSFPTLFSLLDDRYEGDVRRLEARDVDRIEDACFQCKLCEVQCPYTPRDGHSFQLDFPKLMHRIEANRRRGRAPSLRDRLFSDPDGAAKLARLGFGLANALNKVPAHRWVMEKALGIHREKVLPEFAQETFEAWALREGRVRESPSGEAVLFETCFVQNNRPELGRDTLEVMDRNKVGVACARGLVCCGMPAWEHGDLEKLQAHASKNLDVLEPWVDAGAKVLAINPTCSMMLRKEYPTLVKPEDRGRAEKVSKSVRDPGELLWEIRKEGRFSTDFKSTPGKIAYHAPCHLRAQAIGFKGRDLLGKIPGVSISSVMECSAHDGSYAMKVESFGASRRLGERAFAALEAVEADEWVTECPLAAMQFEQHAKKGALHPMTVLARAYREDGFPRRVEVGGEAA